VFEDIGLYQTLLIFAAIILAVSLAAAFVPRVMRLTMRQVHLMVALSAGIFLGILFFMLLPETFHEAHGRETSAVIWIVGGFLAVLFVDVFLKWKHMSTCACDECHDNDHKHELTSFTAFVGLAIHAAVDGILLSIALTADEHIAVLALAGIALHKFVEVFALSSTFMLTGISKRNAIICMVAFALITPIAAVVSMPVVDMLENLEVFIPLAVATGTFMYVGVYALLPEAFHERRDSMVSFALVVIGIILIALLYIFVIGDAHGH
jgi:zinc transporter 9